MSVTVTEALREVTGKVLEQLRERPRSVRSMSVDLDVGERMVYRALELMREEGAKLGPTAAGRWVLAEDWEPSPRVMTRAELEQEVEHLREYARQVDARIVEIKGTLEGRDRIKQRLKVADGPELFGDLPDQPQCGEAG